MINIYVICEGQTEEAFVNQMLAEVFLSRNICLTAVLIGVSGHKGGIVNYNRVCSNIKNLLQTPNFYVTTLVDFYGLARDFPGLEEALSRSDYQNRQETLIENWRNKLTEDIDAYSLERFIPYVQMYEFEALLFSSPGVLAESLGDSKLKRKFQCIRDGVSSPEEINNSPQTAPSKQIQKLVPSYEKVVNGTYIAAEISLDVIRQQCTLFDRWLTQLEHLPEL